MQWLILILSNYLIFSGIKPIAINKKKMRKKVLHIDCEKLDSPIVEKSNLKIFEQTADRFAERKNTQSRYYSIRPHTTKPSMSKTDNYFYKKRSLADSGRKGNTRLQMRRGCSSMDVHSILGKTIFSHSFLGCRGDSCEVEGREQAKRKLYLKIEEHNKNLLSKRFTFGKQEEEKEGAK